MCSSSLALWILNRFGIDEVLVGDLVEQLAGGRSHAWFWRQALSAVASALYRDCRAHPFLIARSMFLGLTAWWAATLLWSSVALSFNMWIGRIILDVFGLHRPMLVLAVSMTNLLLSAPVWFAIGWLVAASSRNRTVLLFLTTTWFLLLPHDVRQTAHALTDLRFGATQIVVVSIAVTHIVAFSISVLAGAVWVKGEPHEIA